MNYMWYDFVGNIGVAFVLGAYLAMTLERISARDPLFSALNASGAVLILISLYYNFNLSSVVIECAWLAISVFGLVRAASRK